MPGTQQAPWETGTPPRFGEGQGEGSVACLERAMGSDARHLHRTLCTGDPAPMSRRHRLARDRLEIGLWSDGPMGRPACTAVSCYYRWFTCLPQ
jgi:hypothetical protein